MRPGNASASASRPRRSRASSMSFRSGSRLNFICHRRHRQQPQRSGRGPARRESPGGCRNPWRGADYKTNATTVAALLRRPRPDETEQGRSARRRTTCAYARTALAPAWTPATLLPLRHGCSHQAETPPLGVKEPSGYRKGDCCSGLTGKVAFHPPQRARAAGIAAQPGSLEAAAGRTPTRPRTHREYAAARNRSFSAGQFRRSLRIAAPTL
jgi:hypothetical protein